MAPSILPVKKNRELLGAYGGETDPAWDAGRFLPGIQRGVYAVGTNSPFGAPVRSNVARPDQFERTVSVGPTLTVEGGTIPQDTSGQAIFRGAQPGAGQVATAQREFGVTGGNVLSRGQMISSMLYQMAPEHIQRATAAYRLRNMSSADKSKELAQRALETDMGFRNQQGFSLRTPLGPSLEDGAMAATPEIQMVHRKARTDFMREFSDMMSTADKTKWRTMEDYEAAVGGLPSVQKYGDMISGTVFNAARKFAGPELRAKFEANDKNAESFQKWAIRNTQYDYNADGVPDTFAEVWTAAQKGDMAALKILRLWEDDPDAEKYEAIGDKIQRKQPGAAERMTMAQREIDMQTAQARKAVEASGGTMEMAPPPGAQLTPEAMLGRKQTLTAQQIEFDRKRSQEWISQQPDPSKWIVDVNGQPKETKKAEGEDFAQFFGTKAPKDETTMRRIYQEMSKLWSEAEFGTEKTPPPFTTLAERYSGVTDETEAQERWRADEQKKAAELYRAKSKAYDFNAWQLTGDLAAQPGRAVPAAAPSVQTFDDEASARAAGKKSGERVHIKGIGIVELN